MPFCCNTDTRHFRRGAAAGAAQGHHASEFAAAAAVAAAAGALLSLCNALQFKHAADFLVV
jgi:hypothetical protein